ncbi:signal peptidase I [Enterococcus rotai]|uniref:signal peptidase I n=1 Tax=Enterococcus rotai TaxID=118060 RepID=UPI0032B42833
MKDTSQKLKSRKRRKLVKRIKAIKKKQHKTHNRRKSKNKKKSKILMIEFVISLFITMLLIYIVSVFTFSIREISGYSMMPTLEDRNWVYINKMAKLRRFNLVAYTDEQSKEIAIRRLIGLPGETIYYQKDTLFVNGEEVFERFLVEQVDRSKNSNAQFTKDWDLSQVVPENKYVVLGDNRPYATDSREYGFVDKKNVIGVVEMRVFPFHELKKF